MIKLFIFLACAFHLVSFDAVAQENKSYIRKISGEEMQTKMFNIERTFWGYKNIDRFHFKTDGELRHQINGSHEHIPQGSILIARYAVRDNSLCWQYTPESVQQFSLQNNTQCYDLFTREDFKEFMIGNHPSIRLKQVGATAEAKTILNFYSWHRDDYIYDPKYVKYIDIGMDRMEEYRKKYLGVIPGGTINRENLSDFMKEYYDIAIGKVFAIDRDYMYFLPNGDFYWITGDRIDSANEDLEEMIRLTSRGKWLIKDNIHCWRVGKGVSCEFVFPRGKGLNDRKFDSFLGTFHTGMTRIHDDSVEHVRHIDPSETEKPELFMRLKQISEAAS